MLVLPIGAVACSGQGSADLFSSSDQDSGIGGYSGGSGGAEAGVRDGGSDRGATGGSGGSGGRGGSGATGGAGGSGGSGGQGGSGGSGGRGGAGGSGGGTGSCAGLPDWTLGSYSGGDEVQHNGHKYMCRTDQGRSGWCGMSNAYEPGVGTAWQEAWTDEGVCQ